MPSRRACISWGGFSPDCFCRNCALATERDFPVTLYLKPFDDTSPIRSEPAEPSHPRVIIGTPGCDCGCDRCVDRRVLGKKPIHLKSYDNTTSAEDANYSGSTDCLRLCLRCRYPGQTLSLLEALRITSLSPPDNLDEPDSRVRPDPDCMECQVRSMTIHGWSCNCGTCVRSSWDPYDDYEDSQDDDGNTSNGYEDSQDEDRDPSWDIPRVQDKVYDGISLLNHGVDYECCTPRSLKHLIQRRGLEDDYPAGVTLPYFYIPKLKASDQAFRFRFMDLPAELRNQVCYELLNGAYGECHPEILSTSRKIHNDSTGLLYADRSLTFEFYLRYYSNASLDILSDSVKYEAEVRLHHDYLNFKGERPTPDVLDALEMPEDSKFHRIGTLVIDLTQHDVMGSFVSHKQNRFKFCGAAQNSLMVFASSLMGTHNIKNIVIYYRRSLSWDGPMMDESEWIEFFLYPLRRIRGIQKVEISGIDLPELAAAMISDMQSDQMAFNTWKEIRKVQTRLSTYLDCIRTHDLEYFAGRWGKFDELLYLSTMPPWFFDINEAQLIDEEHENGVRADLAELESLLKALGPVSTLTSRLGDMEWIVMRHRPWD